MAVVASPGVQDVLVKFRRLVLVTQKRRPSPLAAAQRSWLPSCLARLRLRQRTTALNRALSDASAGGGDRAPPERPHPGSASVYQYCTHRTSRSSAARSIRPRSILSCVQTSHRWACIMADVSLADVSLADVTLADVSLVSLAHHAISPAGTDESRQALGTGPGHRRRVKTADHPDVHRHSAAARISGAPDQRQHAPEPRCRVPHQWALLQRRRWSHDAPV